MALAFFGVAFTGVFFGDCVFGILLGSCNSLSVCVSDPDEISETNWDVLCAGHVRLLWPGFPHILQFLRLILLQQVKKNIKSVT